MGRWGFRSRSMEVQNPGWLAAPLRGPQVGILLASPGCRVCWAVWGLRVPLGRGSLTGLQNPPPQQQSGSSRPEQRTTALELVVAFLGALPYFELLLRTKTTNPTQTKSFGNKEARTKGMIFQSCVGSNRVTVWGRGGAQRLRWVGP